MDIETKYQETLDYLYRFVDFSLTRDFRNMPENFDLGRMFEFMDFLGNPHYSYPVIHVAGTKGKGSVCVFCASSLQAAGYRVGLYTSPHLHDYAERIQINDRPIPHTELINLVAEIKPYLDKGTRLTTFEITTALAFLYFARHGATAVVAEVGLGGRLDATNIVRPVVSVITSLSYDHMQVLGSTLDKIAIEKAGIIKPEIPVVIAPQDEVARFVLQTIAADRHSPLVQVGMDYCYKPVCHSLKGQMFDIWSIADQVTADEAIQGKMQAHKQSTRLTIPLLGAHQVDNAAVAFAALRTANIVGLPIELPAIEHGFSNVVWPGRFEVLRRKPPIVIDSAHNRDSARRLRQALQDYFPGWPVCLVIGASEDKDIEGILAELLPVVNQVIATRSFHPRAIEPERLVELAFPFEKPVRVVAKIEDAFIEAITVAGNDHLILGTGSLFIAAAARETWQKIKLSVPIQP